MRARDASDWFVRAWMLLYPGEPFWREYQFHPTRKWRFDVAWPEQKLAVEIDGRGRHQTISGVRKDYEKHNEATRMGWRVLRFPATDRARVNEWVRLARELLCCPPADE